MADILIRGMEMPNNVFDCPLNSFGICNLAQDETHCDCIGDSRPEWCPLVPLPEGHGRLIDANELELDLVRHNGAIGFELIGNAPTIVPAGGGDNER